MDAEPGADEPKDSKLSKFGRITLNAASGAIPFAGGLLAAAASEWSEREQDRINKFLKHWLRMLQDEMREKEKTILEITSRLDMRDEDVAERVASPEYQSILKKSFRDWAGTESEDKRILLRNLLVNAASSKICSDDVVKLFLVWIQTYSEFHFSVISKIYNSNGITRGEMWQALGRAPVREDSADADLFKLLIRDLSTGGIVRQHREVDWQGNPVRKQPSRRPAGTGPAPIVSAFDNEEGYELTALGQQFVHYAMTEVTTKLTYQTTDSDV